jgi:thiol-disulfide isomerase/thioredoxin
MILAAFLAAALTLPAGAPSTVKALPILASISVDGTDTSLNAYNINNYTYFMLRDVATLLNATPKRFEIGYHSNTGTVALSTGKRYTGAASGAPPIVGDAVGIPSTSAFELDGKPIVFEAYNIDGKNYLKIRDLAEALSVKIDYDSNASKILLDTEEEPVDFGFGRVASFKAKSISGEEYTNELFKEKPLTFINYWATWSGPCRAEIPDFPLLYQAYKDKVQFVTVIEDAYSGSFSYAKQLSARYLSNYLNLYPEKSLTAMMQTGYVPTTILVNKDGSLVMEPLIGAYGADYAQSIDQALKKVGA